MKFIWAWFYNFTKSSAPIGACNLVSTGVPKGYTLGRDYTNAPNI